MGEPREPQEAAEGRSRRASRHADQGWWLAQTQGFPPHPRPGVPGTGQDSNCGWGQGLAVTRARTGLAAVAMTRALCSETQDSPLDTLTIQSPVQNQGVDTDKEREEPQVPGEHHVGPPSEVDGSRHHTPCPHASWKAFYQGDGVPQGKQPPKQALCYQCRGGLVHPPREKRRKTSPGSKLASGLDSGPLLAS